MILEEKRKKDSIETLFMTAGHRNIFSGMEVGKSKLEMSRWILFRIIYGKEQRSPTF